MFISIATINGHHHHNITLCYGHHHHNITLCYGHHLSSTSHLKFQNPPTTLSFSSSPSKPFLLTSTNTNASNNNNNSSIITSLETSNKLRHLKFTTSRDEHDGGEITVSSASAVASAIRRCSTSPVKFVQRIEKGQTSKLVMPSSDFLRLCVEQLDLFRRVVNPEAVLSVYVRPAGSYVMDRLELRRITSYPGGNTAEVVILVGNFNIPTGLRAAEAALSCQQVELVTEHRAVVFPMVKHPFVVGFLVAELPEMEVELPSGNAPSEEHDLIHFPSPEEAYGLSPDYDKKFSGIRSLNDQPLEIVEFTAEQRTNAIHISQSLAMAYVMDQKAMLLQQSSWQNNVRMSNLVEQIRGPLSSLRTLSKMLSTHVKKSEISYDIVEDILVQGDRISNTLQELQDAVYLTKANIVHYNEETLKRIPDSSYEHHDSMRSQLSDSSPRSNDDEMRSDPISLNVRAKDLEMPMPPLALAPLQHGVRKTVQCF
ncbi:hypothetical protein K2173_011791 [Erythroxylum novogranatense]|uniref:Chloroplast sensor kinase n=1 Tax=Erythroxylum novogranatense TaxID=1862640 RepID=A0AAV8S5C9_9ROSI|nr:hypothetical protein K2173_011791 [Erythroxylum novogranatense]